MFYTFDSKMCTVFFPLHSCPLIRTHITELHTQESLLAAFILRIIIMSIYSAVNFSACNFSASLLPRK